MRDIQLLLKLYYRPLAAISGIIDTGSWVFGAILVVAISAAMPDVPLDVRLAPRDLPHLLLAVASYGVFKALAGIAVCIVPVGILCAVTFESIGSFAVIFRRDFASLLACATMSWSAAHLLMLPLAFAGLASTTLLWCVAEAIFAVLLTCVFRTLYGAAWPTAAAIALLSIASLPVGAFAYMVFGRMLSFIASPFILYYLWMASRGEIGDITSSFRNRQNFRRMMEAASLNPHDPDPHYQLGLIYQQRRQYPEAIERFEKAVAIDKSEGSIDAHFQLARIAREQSRFDDALQHLDIVARFDDKYSLSEVWREIGATLFAMGRTEDAAAALEKFVTRRAYDAEGLYWMGETLLKLNRADEAKEYFQRAVEAVDGLPANRRGIMRKWAKLAGSRL